MGLREPHREQLKQKSLGVIGDKFCLSQMSFLKHMISSRLMELMLYNITIVVQLYVFAHTPVLPCAARRLD